MVGLDERRVMRTAVPLDDAGDLYRLGSGYLIGDGLVLTAAHVLECTEGSTQRRLIFSADVGRWGLPIIRDPRPPEGAGTRSR